MEWDVHRKTEWFQNVLTSVCDASMARAGPRSKRAAYWWSENIADLRRETVIVRRHMTRSRRRGVSETRMEAARNRYREARRALRDAIHAAKAVS